MENSSGQNEKEGLETPDHKNKFPINLNGEVENLQTRFSSVKQKGRDLMESSGINSNFTNRFNQTQWNQTASFTTTSYRKVLEQ